MAQVGITFTGYSATTTCNYQPHTPGKHALQCSRWLHGVGLLDSVSWFRVRGLGFAVWGLGQGTILRDHETTLNSPAFPLPQHAAAAFSTSITTSVSMFLGMALGRLLHSLSWQPTP